MRNLQVVCSLVCVPLNKERIEFDEFYGRDAVKMTVNYDDGGHRDLETHE